MKRKKKPAVKTSSPEQRKKKRLDKIHAAIIDAIKAGATLGEIQEYLHLDQAAYDDIKQAVGE
ncbi:MAG: hypothetical protein ACPG7F_00275 [Aggregatilineales bacterium]